MQKKIILSFVVILCLALDVKSQPYFVRAACYWTSPVMNLAEAKNLSHYQILIVDEENLFNNPESLELVKKLNSKIELIIYSNPMEIFEPMVKPRPWQKAIANEIKEKYPQWLLKTSAGENVVFYPGMIMLNISSNCPRINGKNCVEYLAEKQLEVLKDTLSNGYFMDNGGANINWVNNKIDSNNDRISDDSTFLNRAWLKGIDHYLGLIKQGMRKGCIILANKGSLDFLDKLDGRMFENWPNTHLGGSKDGGWHRCMINATKTGAYTIFLVKQKDLMFGLASALLTDNVYIAVGQDNSMIHSEFNYDLGKPLGNASVCQHDSCYFRLYQKGKVEVIPSLRKGIITLYK